ncbi:hypothetical protein Sinac_2450 [Singulisphaera acidiphila DSM 18658]|uniref:Uncharacterized protein n=1 Tax=Singulisphaera acidiphila (strain ATCC BAA-1392 / DSM 18658 / VKM B-2454 / MOB10) TaxID=886293 RepID=L0DDL5_SINAD|nr:hypothetical protein Sinac_2450 [Singulisphaera acidiphila DSM 18658]
MTSLSVLIIYESTRAPPQLESCPAHCFRDKVDWPAPIVSIRPLPVLSNTSPMQHWSQSPGRNPLSWICCASSVGNTWKPRSNSGKFLGCSIRCIRNRWRWSQARCIGLGAWLKNWPFAVLRLILVLAPSTLPHPTHAPSTLQRLRVFEIDHPLGCPSPHLLPRQLPSRRSFLRSGPKRSAAAFQRAAVVLKRSPTRPTRPIQVVVFISSLPDALPLAEVKAKDDLKK